MNNTVFTPVMKMMLKVGIALVFTGASHLHAAEPPTATASRLTAEERELLLAFSDTYYYRNQLQDVGMARMDVFARFADSPDPLLKNIAAAANSFYNANKLAQMGPTRAEALQQFGNDWRNFVNQSIGEAILSFGRAPADRNSSDGMRQAEQLLAGPQNQAIWERSMICLIAGVRKSMRERAAALMESRDENRREAQGVMLLRLAVKDGEIWMNVTNHTIRPLHNCLITAHREQNSAKVDEQQKDTLIGAGLGFLIGMSQEANARNVTQDKLRIETQKAEYGGLVFVPELRPNESVSFAMAPQSNLRYTTGIFASLWCDEGKELNATASLQGLEPTDKRR